jgi:murein DD-endopeptidase MepM/ murein hydrolase activator NlpD
VGAAVVTGEYLGLVGSSGCSSNPHLHLEIHDKDGKVIEPYAGTCNSTTPSTWWANQKPYQEPSLNRLTTHAIPPVFDGFCPNEEKPNLDNQFDPATSYILPVGIATRSRIP